MADPQNYEEVVKTKAEEGFAQFDDDRKGLLGRFQHTLHVNPALVPLIILVMAIAIFGMLLGQRFFSPGTLTLILQQVQIVGVLAAAQTLIILTAGIDLSVGAIAVLCSVVMGQFTFRYGFPAEMSLIIGLLFGAGIGAISGFLVSRVKIPPFIATLGMWQIVLATTYLFSRNETLRSSQLREEAQSLLFLGNKISIGGANFTYGVILMILIVVGLAYALR